MCRSLFSTSVEDTQYEFLVCYENHFPRKNCLEVKGVKYDVDNTRHVDGNTKWLGLIRMVRNDKLHETERSFCSQDFDALTDCLGGTVFLGVDLWPNKGVGVLFGSA
ncbi:hypothetical protein RRG08_005452 [Elysia crispata]|uniref:Uncharacterized protein n=1 Tax=Elysia crispata TaxID=231223 RepID=A0AAE0Y1E1_9GAST|nr:hypothetical protein RRG08_005452 [Elysia crispata]